MTSQSLIQSSVRSLIRAAMFIAAPFVVAEALAFGSFIYEEALQASGFAVRNAMIANDFLFAANAVKSYRTVMQSARTYQDWLGCFAFWTHDAYETYFNRVAENQLISFYAAGVKQQLWTEPEWRFLYMNESPDPEALKRWTRDAKTRLVILGFDSRILDDNWEPPKRDRVDLLEGPERHIPSQLYVPSINRKRPTVAGRDHLGQIYED